MKNLIEIIPNKLCDNFFIFDGNIKKLKTYYNFEQKIFIDNSLLFLDQSWYGQSKKETKLIQKAYCKKILNSYKKLKKLVRFLNHKNKNFNNKIYFDDSLSRHNNNDFLLESMLNLHFNIHLFRKTNQSILYACDYLDKENSLHNMCDFKDNRCAKHRAYGFNRSTGCCPSSCKFQHSCPCTTKNLSCKLIMCDYLEQKGYYFSVQAIPILRLTMNPLERLCCWGMFFKSTKQTFWYIFWVRVVEIGGILALISIIFSLI